MTEPRHNITITSKSGFKIEEIDLLEIAAHYFMMELDKIKPIGIVNAEIHVVDEVLSESGREPLYGDMTEVKKYKVLDNGDEIDYYVCRLADYANSADTLQTLAHELTHVWQSANGSLVIGDLGDWSWKGKNFGTTPYNATNDDYDLPWEREADTLDVKLVRRFYKTYFQTGKTKKHEP